MSAQAQPIEEYVRSVAVLMREAATLRALPRVPDQELTAHDWAYQHGSIRTADGTTHRYADVARTYQDRILSDTSNRVIIAKSRQIGISQTVAFIAACEAEAGGTVLWLSRTGEQAGEALRYVYTALSERHPQYATENRYSLVLANGGRVITQPATRGAGRGIPATLVIVDEQAWQEYAREVYTAVLPTLATTNGRLIVLSTPNGRGNLFAELWFAAQDPTAGWSTHFLPWSVHPEWSQVPDWPARKMDQDMLTAEAFAQEYGVDFLTSGAAVFDQDEIDALWRLPSFVPPQTNHRYVTAWDIARKADATVGFTYDVSTAPFQVVAYERHQRMSYPDQANAITARAAKYPGKTVVESNGVGDPLIQFLPIRVEEFQTTALTKRNAIDALKLLLQRRELISPRIDQWSRELAMYQREDNQIVQDTVMAAAIAALVAGRPARVVGAY